MVLPGNVREAILESIGSSGKPEASSFLRDYLGDSEQGIRRAAVRGLAATGRAEDAQFLGEWMSRPALAIEESTEVALALGGSRAPNATAILMQAYPKADRDELVQCLILGLAQRPFEQTQGFFRQLLGDPAIESDRKKEDSLIPFGKISFCLICKVPILRFAVAPTSGWAFYQREILDPVYSFH